MDIQRFRDILDSLLVRPVDPSAEVHLSIATELRNLDNAAELLTPADLEASEWTGAYDILTESGQLPVWSLIDFNWTFEGPPSWDDRIEIWEPDASTAYIWLHPDEEIGRGWLPLARIEPPNNMAAYEWLLREMWGAPRTLFGPKFELLPSLPTGITIQDSDKLSLAGVRAALAIWLGDDPTTQEWEQLLDRVRSSAAYTEGHLALCVR